MYLGQNERSPALTRKKEKKRKTDRTHSSYKIEPNREIDGYSYGYHKYIQMVSSLPPGKCGATRRGEKNAFNLFENNASRSAELKQGGHYSLQL